MTGQAFQAVIFDLDGLVLDSESGYVAAWRKAARAMGYRLDEENCRALSGLSAEDVRGAMLRHFGEDFDLCRFEVLGTRFWQRQVNVCGIPVKKGVFELLDVAGRLKLPTGLATNSSRADVLACLESAGLEGMFSIIVAGDEVQRRKPAADIFFRAAAGLGKPIETCLVLEDSVVGVTAALAAGAPCWYVPSVNPPDRWAVAHAAETVTDLTLAAELLLTGANGRR